MRTERKINFWRTAIPLAVFVLLCILLISCAKKAQKVYRIGIVSGVEVFAGIADGFKAKMGELGYSEGKNIIYDCVYLNADPAGEKRVVGKFVADKVDLIFAFPTEPAQVAKAAVKETEIPVIFAHAGLEGCDLVDSIPKPGGNITGTRFPGPDLIAKRFEFLLELVPNIKRLYIPYDKNYPNSAPALAVLRPAALSKGVNLVELPVISLEQIQADIETRIKSANIGVDAILLLPEMLTQTPDSWAVISKFAREHKLPLIGSSDKTAEMGGLFSYNVDPVETGRLAAVMADKVLKGTPAGSIMIVTPPSHLHINYKTAEELGIVVPEGLLSRADKIIR